ncbi:hypothetical protein VLK31_19290 [Variovorax sp. H27-G14]|uniref:hypothetical protein n=1 Tax=Variovorax sp. H27-G14 TaxID=3111914 RepID=UPI0038FC4ED1
MFHSSTSGGAPVAAPSPASLSNTGAGSDPQHSPTLNDSQEFAALWHFFYKFMESLTHLRWCEDKLWRRIDGFSYSEPKSMRILIEMMALSSPKDRMHAHNLFLVWKLCSRPAHVAFSQYADAWLRGLRTFSLPEHLPSSQFRAPPEVVGSFETAALIACLIYGAVGHVDTFEVRDVWVRASHWINLAVSDSAEAGKAFRSLCWATAQLDATHRAYRQDKLKKSGVSPIGISADWVRRYRHAEIKIHWGAYIYQARKAVGLSEHQFDVARRQLQR